MLLPALLPLLSLRPAPAALPLTQRGRAAREAAFKSFRAADLSEAPLLVEGELPSWLRGTFIRNGPGLYEVGERRMRHWFDGYAMLTRVHFAGSERAPLLTSRFVETDAFAKARRGEMAYAEFMTPLAAPGSGLLGALRSLASLLAGKPTDNACVNLVDHGGSILAMTETHTSWVRIDPISLRTGERVSWSGADVGILGTAHPMSDPAGGGLINVATDISPPFFSGYHVFKLNDDAPWRRQVIASIPSDDKAIPRWMHSFGVTHKTVVLIEQPAAYSLPGMLGLRDASHASIQWLPERGTRVHVLDRKSGKVAVHVVQPAFFFFHVCNSFDYDDANGRGVCVDLCAFDDCEILSALSLDRLTKEQLLQDLPNSRILRLRIPAGGSEELTMTPLDDTSVSGWFADLPSINPLMAGNSSYKYVYSIAASRPTAVSNLLVKSDVSGAGRHRSFGVPGMLPGEPLFVPRPGGTEEDDGVLLSWATDPDGGSSLYILSATNMCLMARCKSPVTLPAGFHAKWLADEHRS
ncbi:hypothetical protein AB1Y20_017540 [Prymnesium parvum]|uniref:Uncharacterized protein n=1 Tax=Prymnesium parvum TaxID=97485 RepID=A0AB34JKJ5_PRYPA